MLELPDLPLGRTTRYIQCISCEERFAITEEYKRGNFGRSAHRSPDGSGWHVVPEHHPHTHRREVLPFHQRRIHPEPVSTVQNREDPQVRDRHRHLVDINCPRCGADNRNWAQILEHPHSIKWFFGSTYGRVPLLLTIGVILAAIGLFLVFAFVWSVDVFFLGVPLALGLMLAVFVPIWWSNHSWNALLAHRRARNFLPNYSGSHPLIRPLLYIWLFIVFGLPLLLYVVLPRGWHLFMPNSQLVPYEDLSFLVNTWLANDVNEEQIRAGLAFWRNIQVVGIFLVFWSLTTGIIGGVASLVAASHVGSMVSRMDQQLPPPVYHSVANMTRLVIWEMQHALDANEALAHVQWEHVARNESGGISLRGCLRERPTYDADGMRTDDRVNAHRYHIETDRWCRVAESSVRHLRVPAALNTQQQLEVIRDVPYRPRFDRPRRENGQAPRPLPLAAD